jgi:hypothetical protein
MTATTASNCRETVETLPDRVRMRWPAVEREHVVTGVVVTAKELAFAVLDLAPAHPIDGDGLMLPESKWSSRGPH